MLAELKPIKELPKEELALLSQYQIENSKYWFYSLHHGNHYIIPVDKNMHKIIKKIGLWDFEKVVCSVIDAIYLQVRARMGDNIEMMLSQQIDKGFRELYSPKLRKRIEDGFNLLEFKKKQMKKIKKNSVKTEKLCKNCGYLVGHPNKEVVLVGGKTRIH